MSAHEAVKTDKPDHGSCTWAIALQWVIYIGTGIFLGLYGLDLFARIETRTAGDSVRMIVWGAIAGTIWTIATFAIRRGIHVPDPESLPDPKEPGINDEEKFRRTRARKHAAHEAVVAEAHRESVLSQFVWAGMLVGVALGIGAVGLAGAPISTLTGNAVPLILTPVFAAIFMFCLRLKKLWWSMIPAAGFIGCVVVLFTITDWSEWGFGFAPRGYHAKLAAAREASARGLHHRATALMTSAGTLTDSDSPATPLQRFELGRVHESAGDYKSALEAYLATLQWYADRPGTYDAQLQYRASFNASVMYWHLGSYVDARTMARQARGLLTPQMAGEMIQHEGEWIPRVQMVDSHLAFLEGF